MRTVAIVGTGVAGATAALTLRAEGFDGRVILIGDEPVAPYRRPALSKDLLRGTVSPAKVRLQPHEVWWGSRIELRRGCMVVGVDPGQHTLGLDDGTEIGYDQLLLATGSRPRQLWQDVDGVHTLRTMADAERLRATLVPDARLVIIGAGLVGLEVAATARSLGCAVAVLEAEGTPLARAVPASVGEVFVDLHRSRGVDLCTGVRVDQVERAGDALVVSCTDGRWWVADVVLVAAGTTPNTALADFAGVRVDDGIVVDAFGRTNASDVFAAGDVANLPNLVLGGRHRIEHWRHAGAHGAAVARAMLGERVPYRTVPQTWSDQFGVSLRVFGWPGDGDVTVHGAPEELDFAAVVRRGGSVVGGVGVRGPAAVRTPRLRSVR
ncbi:FAD-dependent oxidoreductase [Actinokineospora sp. NBRC 105648]|uniref:NAD(P)/FAD-dependent oxidoreductase n=1 Tax=Actinokineospora sp. NBRC 105648 TaxID=3032206 RepID=UPI0024A2523A|nr:FAD-dependent oxidoreductase [Actinokineospora sp. NBRC 105648]GLZ42568.1 pyridine nucleotide-disulfide oxidoreductase [Actinokineospora sp. NBRC 105648]